MSSNSHASRGHRPAPGGPLVPPPPPVWRWARDDSITSFIQFPALELVRTPDPALYTELQGPLPPVRLFSSQLLLAAPPSVTQPPALVSPNGVQYSTPHRASVRLGHIWVGRRGEKGVKKGSEAFGGGRHDLNKPLSTSDNIPSGWPRIPELGRNRYLALIFVAHGAGAGGAGSLLSVGGWQQRHRTMTRLGVVVLSDTKSWLRPPLPTIPPCPEPVRRSGVVVLLAHLIPVRVLLCDIQP